MRRGPFRRCRRCRRCNGFSLIATLLIVAMVAIAIVGFLSVVTTETATTRLSAQRAEARANAMVGLRKAIAQLQEHAGPDQRITATAAILESGEEDTSVSVEHPYWTGVWSTTQDNGGRRQWIERDAQSGSWVDARSSEDDFYSSASNEERALVWLVSGDGSELPTEAFDEEDKEILTMVGSPYPDEPERPGAVRVRKVELQGMHNGKPRTTGHYAYWVGDEGVKAKLNVFNPYASAQMVPDEAEQHGYRQLYVSPSPNYSLLLQNPDMLEEDKRKILTSGRLLAYQRNLPEDFNRRLNGFHTTTAYSLGVLCDVRDGGLKEDLTAYLSQQRTGSSLRDDMPIYDGFPGFSPEFGRLRSWARSGSENPFEEKKAEADPLFSAQRDATDDSVERAYLSTAMQLPDLEAQDATVMKPLLVEASLYYVVSKLGSTSSNPLRMHIYPRVVLWNPYSVTLRAQRYAAVVTGSSFRMEVELKLPTGAIIKQGVRHVAPNLEEPSATGYRGDSTGTYGFALQPVDIGPGECLVFSAANSGSTEYSRTKLGANVLSATVAPGTRNFYLDDCFPNVTFPPEATPIRYEILGGELPNDDQMHLKVATSTGFSAKQLRNMPLIQTVSCRRDAGDKSARPGGGGDELGTVATLVPPFESYEGCRMGWLKDDATLPLSLLHFNLHGALHIATPWDSSSGGDSSQSALYHFDAADPQMEFSSYGAQKLKSRKWGGNPFARPSEWSLERYVLFDVPRSHTGVLSLAQFQHAPVSVLGWDALYAMGNSVLPARLSDSPDLTIPDSSGDSGGWTSEWQQGIVQQQHEKPLVYDTSYEMNHALWDRFFLSGASDREMREFVDDPVNAHLPNARLVINDFEPRAAAASDLNNARRAASKLLVNGAFNVHCTEPEAWAVVLAGNRGRAFGGEEHLGKTPFPRFADPAVGVATTESIEEKTSWQGYRVLTDQEIETLAGAIVDEIKMRAPFVSMADFVNRRLTDDETTSRSGVLQSAIDQSGLNGTVGDLSAAATTPQQKAAGGPWCLTQADLLTSLGPVLTVRSDTFLIKAYGDAIGLNGKVVSSTGCEAVVQRTPEPIDGDLDPTSPSSLGRKFRIVSFRWTGP
ncbi:MAG: type II secretory pathway pseudopilin PulG [Verrucomicrobiales bacterium]|jgi:type II secretory pathway pseudopilin PulG